MTLTNRILSALLALALLIGGLLAAAEIALAQLGRSPWLISHQESSVWLAEQSWESTTVRSVLAATLLIGLLLMVTAVRRGKPALVQLPTDGDPGVRWSPPAAGWRRRSATRRDRSTECGPPASLPGADRSP